MPVSGTDLLNVLWNQRKFSRVLHYWPFRSDIILSMARAAVTAVFLPILCIAAVAQTPPASPAQPASQAKPAPSAAPTPAGPGGFVGSNACRICHADVFQNFFRNPHFKSLASGKDPPERTGCDGCHGPG